MHYKTRKFRTKDNRLFVTCADSNVWPRDYYEAEYAEQSNDSVEEKLKSFFESALEGNFQPVQRGTFRTLIERADEIKRVVAYTNLRDDFDFCIDGTQKINRIVAEYMLDVYKDELKKRGSSKSIIDPLPYKRRLLAADLENAASYKEKLYEYDAKRQILISCASKSNLFKGWDALIGRNGNTVYLAKASNYNNRGLLDNKDESAILVASGKGCSIAARILMDGGQDFGTIDWSLFKGMTISKLPYDGFDPTTYGMILDNGGR